MKVTVFAATGRVGRLIVDQALAAGHDVTAVARNPDRMAQDVPAVAADLLDPPAHVVETALAGTDAVLSGLGQGSRADAGIAATGTRAIVRAMRAAGVARIVAISASPVATVASPGRPNPPRRDSGDGPWTRLVAMPVLKSVFRGLYEDLAVMEDVLREDGLDWTVVRPPRLTNGRFTGTYRTAVDHNVRGGSVISRADVAHCMVNVLDRPETIGRAIGLAN